jgi:very-short-patch-repair endonuclease
VVVILDKTKQKYCACGCGQLIINPRCKYICGHKAGIKKDKIFSLETRQKLSISHMGKPSWNKGKPMSEDTKRKLSESKRGKPSGVKGLVKNDEWRRKIGETLKGRHLTQETKQKLSAAHVGKKFNEEEYPNYGMRGKHRPLNGKKRKPAKYNGRKCSPLSTERKLKISNALKGKPHPFVEGQAEKISKKLIEYCKSEKGLKQRAKTFSSCNNTKPERLMQSLLTTNNIIFKTHVALFGLPDIFISPNLCIFVDGNYWHTQPKALIRDSIVNDTLGKQGYIVLRLWEKDIYKKPDEVWAKVKNALSLLPVLLPVGKAT